ncbi:MAG: hypothetical protein IPP74_04435 [Alphaproteobacteria bacterium]|nr:hypothetical protein [Alphaproteobacteria bacterium]
MKKHLLVAILASAVAMPAFAADKAAAEKGAEKAAQAPAAQEHAAPAQAAKQQQAQTVELKDGTQIQIKGEEVFVVGKDAKLTPAPDGSHAAKDGSTINTKDGKIAK